MASWLFGFSASGLLGFLWVYAAFGGFLALAFRILCIPSSSSAGGVLAFAAFRWFMWLLAALAFRILCFPSSSHPLIGFWMFLVPASSASPPPYLNNHVFEHHAGGGSPPQIVCRVIAPLFESTLLQTGVPPPPRYFLDFLQRLSCSSPQVERLVPPDKQRFRPQNLCLRAPNLTVFLGQANLCFSWQKRKHS